MIFRLFACSYSSSLALVCVWLFWHVFASDWVCFFVLAFNCLSIREFACIRVFAFVFMFLREYAFVCLCLRLFACVNVFGAFSGDPVELHVFAPVGLCFPMFLCVYVCLWVFACKSL